MARSLRKYTHEFKQEAVNLALKSPSIVNTAKESGIPAATLHTWIHMLKKKGNLATVDKSSGKDMTRCLKKIGVYIKTLLLLKLPRTLLSTRSKVCVCESE